MTLRNCFLAPWNPPKASQRLRHLVLWPSENAFYHLETLLRPRSASSTPPELQECPRDCLRAVPQKAPSALATLCFYDPPKLTFGTLKHSYGLTAPSFMTLRNCFLTPWNPPKASQRLQHLVLWPSESAFWDLETLLRPRSASSSPSEPQQCLRDCLRALPQKAPCHSVFFIPPKLTFGTLKPS